MNVETYCRHRKPQAEGATPGPQTTSLASRPGRETQSDAEARTAASTGQRLHRFPAVLGAAALLLLSVGSAPSSVRAAAPATAAVVVIENGGTGPYPAIATEDASLPGITLFHPRDLTPFGGTLKLPVLLWANGACANTTQEHKNFLNELASHGYIILGIGRLDQIETRGEASRQPTNARQLIAALDWITAQHRSAASRFASKIDLAKVAAMGMSCGGLQAIQISSDARITTTVVCNSGILQGPSTKAGMPALTKDALMNFHGPVLYLLGGPKDIAYHNGMDDFARVQHVPIVMTNLDVGHGGTYRQPHGGEFTRVALAWLDWQLKGSKTAAKLFVGENPGLREDPKWTIQTKQLATP